MGLHIYRANEDELLHGCRRGNKNAQRAIYDRYSARMYAICLRYVRDEAEAEDVLVTGFTKAFEKIEQFRGEGSFEGWLKRIMINQSLASLRKNQLRHTRLEVAETAPDLAQASDPLELEDLLNMIVELPDGYRTVFNLYAIDGYSHQEIASRLNISENTSKSQLSRARRYLQKMLSQKGMYDNQKITNDESAP